MKEVLANPYPETDDFNLRAAKTDYEKASIRAMVDEFSGISLQLCRFHQTKNFKEKLRSVYGIKLDKESMKKPENKPVATAWCNSMVDKTMWR